MVKVKGNIVSIDGGIRRGRFVIEVEIEQTTISPSENIKYAEKLHCGEIEIRQDEPKDGQ